MKNKKINFPAIILWLLFLTAANIFAQTTAFNYQGLLTNAGLPPTANYDFQFTLYDAGGAVVAGQQILNVPVTNGVFSVALDFGAGAFPGAVRTLEIAVRPAGGGAFTVLAPRQPINSAPYSIKSLTAASADNSTQLGGIDSTRFVQQDAVGNVSVSGGLTVAGTLALTTVDAATQYNLGGQRILSSTGAGNLFVGTGTGASNSGTFNTFVGTSAGNANTTGKENTFIGDGAGAGNVTGDDNTFVGRQAGLNNTASFNTFFGALAGKSNTVGGANSFFGLSAGLTNINGSGNSFFGQLAGGANTSGNVNSFFGANSGSNNTTGSSNSFFGDGTGSSNISGQGNSFFGDQSGSLNLTGNRNSFFGINTGLTNVTGSSNTLIGNQADVGANNLTNATAIGAGAVVSQSNSLILGNSANVGIGTSTPNSKLTVAGLIETTVGGVKFPDGTIQTTAGVGAGSGILNQTTIQGGANFNIGGTGAANIFNAATQYNLTGIRFLSGSDAGGNVFTGFNAGTVNAGSNNSFFGSNAGAANTGGSANSFFGFNAGASNTGGINNTFLGLASGINNTNGGNNTFVGGGTGQQNITGTDNSFFGFGAGLRNDGGGNSFFGRSAGGSTTSGSLNLFAGFEAGISNTTGSNNVFVGTRSGELDRTGDNNTFLGGDSGRANSNGSNNTYLGYGAQGFVGGNNLTNATAIGAFANVMQSNSLILGSINGVNSATADTRVGIGTNAPKAKLEVTGGNILVGSPGQGIILKSPNGAACRLLSIDNAGAFVLTAIACP